MRLTKLLFFAALMVLISCQVQKRRYQKGYFVNHSHKLKAVKKSEYIEAKRPNKSPNTIAEKSIPVISGDYPTSAALELPDLKANIPTSFFSSKQSPDSCDVIVFKDGSEVSAKVIEVTPKEVKYKRCDNIEGPSYLTLKKDLFMIKFRNGTREVMKDEIEVIYKANQNTNYVALKKKRVVHPLAPLALAAGILSILVPYFSLIFSFSAASFPPFMFAVMLIIAVVAIGFGRQAITQIKAQPDVYKGKGLAMPGMIMGIVMLCIVASITALILLL